MSPFSSFASSSSSSNSVGVGRPQYHDELNDDNASPLFFDAHSAATSISNNNNSQQQHRLRRSTSYYTSDSNDDFHGRDNFYGSGYNNNNNCSRGVPKMRNNTALIKAMITSNNLRNCHEVEELVSQCMEDGRDQNIGGSNKQSHVCRAAFKLFNNGGCIDK